MALQYNKKPKATYSYLTDPHLFYHLESPIKIAQLLQTGLYQLNGNTLVQLQTLQTLKVSQYTLKKVPAEIREKYTQKRYSESQVQLTFKQNSMLISSYGNGSLKGCGDKSQKLVIKSPNKMIQTKNSGVKEKKSQTESSLKIRGLEQFRKKIL